MSNKIGNNNLEDLKHEFVYTNLSLNYNMNTFQTTASKLWPP